MWNISLTRSFNSSNVDSRQIELGPTLPCPALINSSQLAIQEAGGKLLYSIIGLDYDRTQPRYVLMVSRSRAENGSATVHCQHGASIPYTNTVTAQHIYIYGGSTAYRYTVSARHIDITLICITAHIVSARHMHMWWHHAYMYSAASLLLLKKVGNARLGEND